MAIVGRAEPSGGRRTVHAALRQRAHRMPAGTMLRTAMPLPVYRLSHAGVAHSEPLSRARHIGWRYPVLSGEHVSLAKLRKSGGKLAYAGLIDGALPALLLEAAHLAEQALGSLPAKFQPRLLQIPALRMSVFWFHAPRGKGRLMVLSDGMNRSALTLHSEKEFLRILRTLRRKAPRAAA